MCGCTFTAKKVKYRILGSATMNDPFTNEIADAVRYVEDKTSNDIPNAFIMTEAMFFAKIDSTELKFPPYIPTPPSALELAQMKRFKEK